MHFLTLLGMQLDFLTWQLDGQIYGYLGAGMGPECRSRSGGYIGISSKYHSKVLGWLECWVVYLPPSQAKLPLSWENKGYRQRRLEGDRLCPVPTVET